MDRADVNTGPEQLDVQKRNVFWPICLVSPSPVLAVRDYILERRTQRVALFEQVFKWSISSIHDADQLLHGYVNTYTAPGSRRTSFNAGKSWVASQRVDVEDKLLGGGWSVRSNLHVVDRPADPSHLPRSTSF